MVLLKNVTTLPNSRKRYEWHTDYPTAYYLLSATVADFKDYSFNAELPDGDKVLVQNFVFDRTGLLEQQQLNIDSTADMLYYFSELFGKYPYYKEKYGHCLSPLLGGMEHQTMSTMGNFRSGLVAHELAHQWFGNNVTCSSWQDIWLNEGFASYAEYLFVEEFWTTGQALNYMQKLHERVINDTSLISSVYVPAADTLNPYRVFYSRLSYDKAAAVIHSLRFVINNDKLFFDVLRKYQKEFAEGNATTEQFKDLVEKYSAKDLTDFFNQWIYGAGYPVYSLRWNQLGSKLIIAVAQKAKYDGKTPLYKTPVEFKVTTTNGEQVVRFVNDKNDQEYQLVVEGTVTGVELDPNNWLLNETEFSVRDLSLGVNALTSDGIFVYPNPAIDKWHIVGVKKGSRVHLCDFSGKVLWRKEIPTNYGVEVPAGNLMRGVYILHILDNNGQKKTKKLIKL